MWLFRLRSTAVFIFFRNPLVINIRGGGSIMPRTIVTLDGICGELSEILMDWRRCDFLDGRFGMHWAGNILHESGAAKWDGMNFWTDDDIKVACRGRVTRITDTGGSTELEILHDGGPTVKMWRLIADILRPGTEISYVCEDGGKIVSGNKGYMEDLYDIKLWRWRAPRAFSWEADAIGVCEAVARMKLRYLLQTDEEDIDKLIEMARKTNWIPTCGRQRREIEDCE